MNTKRVLSRSEVLKNLRDCLSMGLGDGCGVWVEDTLTGLEVTHRLPEFSGVILVQVILSRGGVTARLTCHTPVMSPGEFRVMHESMAEVGEQIEAILKGFEDVRIVDTDPVSLSA